ncbi:MAG: hypothetical protein H8D96_07815 [Desulfobacterales bacterium]|uniref:Uncharacterized protein n=1 Tax=Candidatus Desulfatibia vada TaxID=2841696 RepID=A0A8J6TQ67_9BACT|nr:hypothetical protein [Candidatus Desulfatibia vada]
MVPLKAKAWLNLTRRRDAGEKVAEKDIKKHKMGDCYSDVHGITCPMH